jgi:hypothetical protein
MPAIVVEHLSKTYVTYKRPPGVLGALKSLIKRERQYVEAVRDISFTIEGITEFPGIEERDCESICPIKAASKDKGCCEFSSQHPA